MAEPASPTYDSVKFVKQQIEKPGDETAKWKLVTRGMAVCLGIFGVTNLMIFLMPAQAGVLSSLAQAIVISIGSLVSVGCGSIAAVEWKNRSTLDNVVKTTTEADTTKVESNQPVKELNVTRSNYFKDE